MKLKDGHPLSTWVESELRTHFNYRCCETIDDFESSSGFALTRQGLIRSAGTRHVKDDSTTIDDPRYYILGWSNLDKIQSLEEEQQQVAAAAQSQARTITASKQRQDAATDRATKAGRMQSFRTFAEIDWHSTMARGEELEQQKQTLEQSSDKIRDLQSRLQATESQIRSVDESKTDSADQRGALKHQQEEYNRRLAGCEVTLTDFTEVNITSFDSAVSALLDETKAGNKVTIGNASHLQHLTGTCIGEQLSKLQNSRAEQVNFINRSMVTFLSEFPNLKADLSSGVESIPEFLRFEENVRRDDLPRHDQKFQDLMSRDVLVHVVKFQDTLEDHCEEIQSKITHLNAALKSIEYSPRTYITIRATHTAEPDIRNFRGRLKSCLEYGLAPDGPSRENAFRRISELIDLFREKPDWSAKVTDTRNWLSFAVEERDTETGKQENIYEDTSGKSGGQKAKLRLHDLGFSGCVSIWHCEGPPESAVVSLCRCGRNVLTI